MRVLWLVRPGLNTDHGGDRVQIEATRAALAARDVRVTVSDDVRPSFEGFDVVHLWHLDRLWENLIHARRLQQEGRPAVLSTIWWPMARLHAKGCSWPLATAAAVLPSFALDGARQTAHALRARLGGRRAAWCLRFRRGAQRLLDAVQVVLPNSDLEVEQLRVHFDRVPAAVVVPNGVAPGVQPSPVERDIDLLCVGRIEPRKNQLRLIEAVAETDLRLTLVGEAGRFHQRYYDRCQRVAGSQVSFEGWRNRAEVAAMMARAKVHVCPSWYETPGLASLEAALAGCVVVVTDGGSTREYFDEDALYADPGSVASLQDAALRAVAAAPSTRLVERVEQLYTWPRAAELTLEGYKQAVAQADLLRGVEGG